MSPAVGNIQVISNAVTVKTIPILDADTLMNTSEFGISLCSICDDDSVPLELYSSAWETFAVHVSAQAAACRRTHLQEKVSY